MALRFKDPIGSALGISENISGRIVYSYSSTFPHWLLNSFFLFFSILAFLVILTGVVRFWRDLRAGAMGSGALIPEKGIITSIGAAVKSIVKHDHFTTCTTSQSRYLSHLFVFFGFLALTAVTLWVITAGINPLIRGNFIYPFNFWNPWKILANIGGLALVGGCFLMIRDRFRNNENVGLGTFFDWALLFTLLAVGLTGFVTEVLHYARLEPHRHVVYFIHLVFVFSLLIYLPYSKLAHLVYRATALVFAEYSGRKKEIQVEGEIFPSEDQGEKEKE
jgi:quinone-modifying oxidoreductase subunit QmoC